MTMFFTLCLYTHIIRVFSWFWFHEYDICFIYFECWWLCDLHVFYGIYSCFIPYLKDFVLVYKIFHITSCDILHMVEIFKHTLFSNLFLKTPTFTGGWLGDHAHVCFIVKIILNLNMCWEDSYMMYTLDHYGCFNWYH